MFEYNIFESNLKTKVIGRHIKYFKSTKSTNDKAVEILTNGACHGYVIITKNQTNGKGRRGDVWFSTSGKSLTFSIIVDLKKIKNKKLLPIISSISIVDAIQNITNIKCAIKWPNDIILNDTKIGGILIESKTNYMAVGIGINVNEEQDELNLNIKNISSSLKSNGAPLIKLENLLAKILNKFEYYCYKKNDHVIQKWIEYCYHINKRIEFHENNNIVSGIFKGINQNGQGIININKTKQIVSSGIIEL